jgi:hypothetical protein
MLDIPQELKDLYMQNNITKKLTLYFPDIDLTIENNKIVSGSFSIEEGLCSENELTFGSCESAQFKIVVADIIQDISNQVFIATQTVDGIYTMPLGTYRVYTAAKQSDKRFKLITAYDVMKTTDVDVSSWYNSITFPLSVKNLRQSLLSNLGIDYVEQTLTNDDIMLEKTINPSRLVGRDILSRLAEINAGFGHITRDNKFKVIQLSGLGLYPSETLYPSEDLYPSESGEYITSGVIKIDYEEYIVEPITSITLRQDDSDIGVTAGTIENPYIITGNYLLFGQDSVILQSIADKILLQVKDKYYTPHTTKLRGRPYLEVGDTVTPFTRNNAIESFIFRRKLTGGQALIDEISATGNQKRSETVTPNNEIQSLKGKTLRIEKSVDGLEVALADTAEGLESMISFTAEELQTQITDNKEDAESQFLQQADLILLRVEKNGVISAINLSPETVKIHANNIELEGIVTANSNFKILLDGSIEAVNGKFNGVISNLNSSGSEAARIYDGGFRGTSFTACNYANVVNGTPPTNYSIVTPGILNMMNSGKITIINGDRIDTSDVYTARVNGSTPITANNRSDYIYNLYDSTSGVEQVTSFGNNFRPHSSKGDNTVSCGSPSYRWTQVFASTATIGTSDGNLKDAIEDITEFERRVAVKIKSQIKKFKFKDAVAKKGDEARIHYGVIAQDVKAAFESEGLNPYEYAMFCSDTWYEVDGRACKENEEPYTSEDFEAVEVTRLGIRYEELLCFIIASI